MCWNLRCNHLFRWREKKASSRQRWITLTTNWFQETVALSTSLFQRSHSLWYIHKSTVEWSSCSLLNGINPHITEVYKCLTCNASGHVHTTEVCSHTTAISMSLLNQCLNIIRVWHPKAINKHACQQIQSFGIYHENNFWDQCIIVYQTRALNWFKEQKQNRNKQN